VADSRFFVWLHFYDAHAPYDLPAGDLRAPGYQGAIEFMDAQIGRVLAFLGDHALLDRTVIVVVGDHGESLGEHGEPTHGLFIYESVSRVPLMIRTPLRQFRGRVIEDVVRTVDVSPTILELVGVPVPPSVTGVSLIPTMAATAHTPGRDAHIETWYPRDHFGWSELRAVRSARYKLIAAPHPEIYDLAADPAELHNLYDHRPDLRTTLAARLTAIEAGRAAKRPGQPGIDADAQARLATLGYVSGRRPPDSGRPLADPKDNIELYRRILGKDPFPRPDHGAVLTTVKPEDQP
jgi:arylsulfatase A-like enzyme